MKLLFKQDIRKATDLSKPQSIIAYYNGSKGGKKTKIQSSTGHKVLAKHFSEGRVINTYEKHDINASLKEMEAIFHKEIKELKDNGLEPDKSLLIRTIRKAQGLDPEIPEIIYLGYYIDAFIENMDYMLNSQGQLGLAYNTQKNYRHHRVIYNDYEKTRAKEGLNRITLKHATKEDLEHYRNYLTDQQYSPSTIKKRITEIKSISNHAKENKLDVSTAFSEFRNTRQQKKAKEDIIFLTEEEVELIIAPNKELPDYLQNTQRIAIIQLETGARVSEILGEKKGGVFIHPPITKDAFIEDKEGDYIARIKQQKTGKEVNIPIVEERAIEVIKTGLFRVISPQNYNNYIKELGKRQGINQIIKSKERKKLKQGYRDIETEGEKYNYLSSHTFRRTKLSNLYKQGIPEYHIMGISGHAKSETLHAYLGYDPNKEQQTQELKAMLKGK